MADDDHEVMLGIDLDWSFSLERIASSNPYVISLLSSDSAGLALRNPKKVKNAFHVPNVEIYIRNFYVWLPPASHESKACLSSSVTLCIGVLVETLRRYFVRLTFRGHICPNRNFQCLKS